ncbi:MAG: hypothetical protein ACLFMX_06050 [Halobacteriales archaeon]
MASYLSWIELAAYGLGTLGAVMLFVELFQDPSYVEYKPEEDRYRIHRTATTASEYTAFGRVGAFLLALAFGVLFVVQLLA